MQTAMTTGFFMAMRKLRASFLVEFLARLDAAGDLQIRFLLQVELPVELAHELDLLAPLIDRVKR